MGIGNVQARALIDTVKAGTVSRRRYREELNDALNLLNRKIQALDDQARSAERDFAASRPSQYNDFVDALPEPPTVETP